ncbi:unnamed protein product [Cladocopium goreaui]|uniref:Uncharacterized protein n=1 Tax=Cladocopium goreaui TaxID=2562237 RepID=A0A9P1GL76_9DINO|nr:unnamed protein product [Cladocopium goreaui]|mmetsp:Transcript_71235/g.157246  ORF Transcript_71235/g.157246 Transcript_71235/m.157246 type:complete len:214 (-) Transcript_71235:76-717(-)
MAAPLIPRGEDGLIKQEQKMPVSFFPIIIAVSVTMGQALAWPIYLFGHRQAYDAKIDILASLNLGWLYLALLVVYYTKQIVSQHASYVRNHANVSLPNHTVHKVFIPDGGKQLPYVLLEEDGMVGKANRAQRGFENLMEYLPMYLVYLCAIGFVYPFPAFVNACVFFFSRVKYAFDYTNATAARNTGFAIYGMAQACLEGLLLIAGVKALLRA